MVNKFIPILAGNQNLFGGTRLALFENKLNKRYGMFQCVTRVSKNSYILSLSTDCESMYIAVKVESFHVIGLTTNSYYDRMAFAKISLDNSTKQKNWLGF